MTRGNWFWILVVQSRLTAREWENKTVYSKEVILVFIHCLRGVTVAQSTSVCRILCCLFCPLPKHRDFGLITNSQTRLTQSSNNRDQDTFFRPGFLIFTLHLYSHWKPCGIHHHFFHSLPILIANEQQRTTMPNGWRIASHLRWGWVISSGQPVCCIFLDSPQQRWVSMLWEWVIWVRGLDENLHLKSGGFPEWIHNVYKTL